MLALLVILLLSISVPAVGAAASAAPSVGAVSAGASDPPLPGATTFVANLLGNSVTEYAPGASGNVAPSATIFGPNTKLNEPQDVIRGPTGVLFVTNFNSNSVTEYAAGAVGNVTPIATISGPDTKLNGPEEMTLGPTGVLFVANTNTNTVTEYGSGANGDAAPIATISGSGTGLAGPRGLLLDPTGDLFVADTNTNAVTEYGPGASGNAAPLATLAGPHTGLDFPEGLVRDPTGHLFVANFGANSVTRYAPGASGDTAPATTISGSNTGLVSPVGLGQDISGNLFVTNSSGSSAGGISITEYPPALDGNVPPTATVTGSNTGLHSPRGMTVSPSVPVAVSPQFGVPNQTDVFRIGANGAVEVFWVHGAGAWHGPLAISPAGLVPPGGRLAVSNQFGLPNQTDVFVVANDGTVKVLWVDGAGSWNGPLSVSGARGRAVAGGAVSVSNQFGLPNQTDVFLVNGKGAAEVFWVQGAGAWQGPTALTPAFTTPPGASLAVSRQFGISNKTDVFQVTNDGTVKVLWVVGAGSWNGPLGISPANTAPAGAGLVASNQFGLPNQTDVWVVANDGTVKVLFVQGGGSWHGPLGISPARTAPAGAPLAVANQLGIANQTDVWSVADNDATRVLWVDGGGSWNGPLAI